VECHIAKWHHVKCGFEAVDQSWMVALLCGRLGLVGLELLLVDPTVGGMFCLSGCLDFEATVQKQLVHGEERSLTFKPSQSGALTEPFSQEFLQVQTMKLRTRKRKSDAILCGTTSPTFTLIFFSFLFLAFQSALFPKF